MCVDKDGHLRECFLLIKEGLGVPMKKMISIVIPVFNESENFSRLYASLCDVMAQEPRYNFEIILVDDGSRDSSWQKIIELSEHDARIRGLRFSRNFGTQSATSAGYNYAQGDAIITLDADLQHPPSLLPRMIEAWEQGAYVVCPRRISWNENILKRATAWLHYYFLNTYSGFEIPRNVNDFRLIDRQVLVLINSMSEQPRFLRGMLAWTGYKPTFINYESPQRVGGVTGYTWRKLFSLALDGVVGFTEFPLLLSGYIGFFITLVSCGVGVWAWVIHNAAIIQSSFIFFCVGLQFFLLWLVGEYIARLNDAVRNRPLYVIEQRTSGS